MVDEGCFLIRGAIGLDKSTASMAVSADDLLEIENYMEATNESSI